MTHGIPTKTERRIRLRTQGCSDGEEPCPADKEYRPFDKLRGYDRVEGAQVGAREAYWPREGDVDLLERDGRRKHLRRKV